MANRLAMALNLLVRGRDGLDDLIKKQTITAASAGSDSFSHESPSRQNIVDLYQGEWTTALPGLRSSPGHANLFEDSRIAWMDQSFGISGKTVLELGPLEAAHTAMLCERGAKSVLSIEGNRRAFLKCLCVKELYELRQAKFILGDFSKYLSETQDKHDIAVASGVLYHMTDPADVLANLARITDRIYLWTHYFDAETISRRDDKALFGTPFNTTVHGYTYTAVRKSYASAATNWSGFSGGIDRYANWLTRDSLFGLLNSKGFECQIYADEIEHPNGPAIAICAMRNSA